MTKSTNPSETNTPPHQPWYIIFFSGFFAWLSGILFMFFLGAAGVYPESVAGGLITGFLFLTASCSIESGAKSVFRSQISLAASVTGHVWILISTGRLVKNIYSFAIPVTCLLLWSALYIPKKSLVHRLFSSLLVWISLAFSLLNRSEQFMYLIVPLQIIAGTVILTSTRKIRGEELKELGKPAAYASIFMGLKLLATIHGGYSSIHPLPLSLFFGAYSIGLIAFLAEERKIWETPHIYSLFAIIALSLLAPPGLLAAIAMGILGFAFSNRIVSGLSIGFIPLFLFIFYYDLNVTLDLKSWILAGSGIVLLILRKVALDQFTCKHDSQEATDNESLLPSGTSDTSTKPFISLPLHKSWQKAVYTGTLVLILLAVNGMIISKEHVLKNGESLLLKLVPVDPRSLMQGDYMILRYELADVMNHSLVKIPREGAAVVKIDNDKVATYSGIFEGQVLQEDERIIRFTLRGGNIRFGAESYFFQEGHGQFYNKAKYGELKVRSDGSTVLAGLCDSDKKRIVVPVKKSKGGWMDSP